MQAGMTSSDGWCLAIDSTASGEMEENLLQTHSLDLLMCAFHLGGVEGKVSGDGETKSHNNNKMKVF